MSPPPWNGNRPLVRLAIKSPRPAPISIAIMTNCAGGRRPRTTPVNITIAISTASRTMSEDNNGMTTRSFAQRNAQRTHSNANTGISGKPTRKVSLSSGGILSPRSARWRRPALPPLRWLHKLSAGRIAQLLKQVPMLPRSVGGCKAKKSNIKTQRGDVSESVIHAST